ncbi:MAG: glycosyltransferase [Rubrivivax sp.]|nr:MAG: glycosyltransferase [Rubrivivax sp.]
MTPLLKNLQGSLRDALQGFKQGIRAANRHRLYRRRMKRGVDYTAWIAAHDMPTAQDRAAWQAWLNAHPGSPTVGLILHIDALADAALLQRSIDSLQAQVYPHWQLMVTVPEAVGQAPACLVRQLASGDARIGVLPVPMATALGDSANIALHASLGQWIGILQTGDQLHEQALLLLAQAAQAHPDATVIYPDEDRIDAQGRRSQHHFKPDWNADFQRSANYVGHACWILRSQLLAHGGYDPSMGVALDYDTLLRCTEGLAATRVVHLPKVLWHRPMSTQSWSAACALPALQAHLDRTSPGSCASVTTQGVLRVRYSIPSPAPLVSIVICTRNQFKLLQTCIESITRLTTYPRYEIIVVDNGSDESRTLDYLAQLPGQAPRIRVIRDDSPFNYAALNNMAVDHAQGELVALLNNDIEVIHADWLDEMVGHGLRPEVGCVGAKLLYPDDTVQHIGVLVGPGKDAPDAIAAHYLRGIPRDAPGYAQRAIATQQLTAVTAACLVIRKATFLRVGGLDAKHLAVTYNDVDFCLRVRELGLHNVLTPHALLYHHESVSRGRDASGKNQARFLPELAYMQRRWISQLQNDPCYNPNLSHQKPDFLLA